MRRKTTVQRAKTRLFLIPFLLSLVYPLAAQELPVLAILPFEGIAISKDDAATVYNLVENSFSATGVYSLITAEQRDQILGDTDAAACADEECAVEIGKKLSTDQVVLGTVALAEGRYIVNARIVETASSKTLAADSISTTSVEELAQVCDTLTVGLIRRAMPGSLVEKAAAEGKPGEREPGTGEPEVSSGRTEYLEGERRATEEERTAVESGEAAAGQPEDVVGEGQPPPVKRTRADFWPLMNICGGMFMMELGNVMGSVGFELRMTMSETAGDPKGATFGYYLTTSLSYVSWSAAVASVPTYLLVFPEKAFKLSERGKRFFTTGTILTVAGNVLELLACNQRYTNIFLYEDYESAGTDFDELYKRYRRGYVVYSFERWSSYALWLLGGAGMIGAFFIPGPVESPIQGFWDRAILTAGMTLVGLGSVTRTLALNAKQNYVDSGGDEEAYTRYLVSSVLSYSFWAAGGLGMVLPFIADIGRGKSDTPAVPVRPEKLRVEQLQVVPLPQGMVLRITY
jgi:TolB-like protein